MKKVRIISDTFWIGLSIFFVILFCSPFIIFISGFYFGEVGLESYTRTDINNIIKIVIKLPLGICLIFFSISFFKAISGLYGGLYVSGLMIILNISVIIAFTRVDNFL